MCSLKAAFGPDTEFAHPSSDDYLSCVGCGSFSICYSQNHKFAQRIIHKGNLPSVNPLRIILAATFLVLGGREAAAEDGPIRIFGYFQTLIHHEVRESGTKFNSFSLQQLNIFFQKTLARRWSAFVNIEGVNSFDSGRNFGSLKFEEAWVKYRTGGKMSMRVGLQIPTFNNFNEIKNRSPLLPYVIRPFVYETSFEEFIFVEEYVPTRAFFQVYGFLPSNEMKLDYALFIGNSAQVNDDSDLGQTGVDTTSSFLVGGRVGLRYKTMKLGFSATRDRASVTGNILKVYKLFRPRSDFKNIPRFRLGADFSFDVGNLYAEGEWIRVSYRDRAPDISLDKNFYYGTLGVYLSGGLSVYATYWHNVEKLTHVDFSAKVLSSGISYYIHDRITFKAQAGRVNITDELKVDLPAAPAEEIVIQVDPPVIPAEVIKSKQDFYSAAVSVFF